MRIITRKFQLIIQILAVTFMGLSSIPALNAQVHTATVLVRGIACPFCAYGVEKKLKKVEGVESININIEKGTALMKAKEGKSILISQVPKAIRDAGFTPGTIKITAIGMITADEKERLLLRVHGLEKSFFLEKLKNSERDRMFDYARSEELVEIDGIIHIHTDDIWKLTPESVKRVSE